MSFRLAGQVWDVDVPPLAKLLLMALADTANDDGDCWPGIKYIVKKTGVSERTVQNYIGLLECKGVLHVTERKRHDGSRMSNLYRLYLKGNAPKRTVAAMPDNSDGDALPSAPRARGGAGDAPPIEPISDPVTEPKNSLSLSHPALHDSPTANTQPPEGEKEKRAYATSSLTTKAKRLDAQVPAQPAEQQLARRQFFRTCRKADYSDEEIEEAFDITQEDFLDAGKRPDEGLGAFVFGLLERKRAENMGIPDR